MLRPCRCEIPINICFIFRFWINNCILHIYVFIHFSIYYILYCTCVHQQKSFSTFPQIEIILLLVERNVSREVEIINTFMSQHTNGRRADMHMWYRSHNIYLITDNKMEDFPNYRLDFIRSFTHHLICTKKKKHIKNKIHA